MTMDFKIRPAVNHYEYTWKSGRVFEVPSDMVMPAMPSGLYKLKKGDLLTYKYCQMVEGKLVRVFTFHDGTELCGTRKHFGWLNLIPNQK
jgi:hypothetical protein